MERTKKFNMLSVVAYGIHSRVRRMIESAIDSSPPDARAYWPQLRPFYFYEYFLDPPVIRELDPSEVAAFAPFLKRLVIERDFVPFPTGGYKRITADLFGELVQKRAVPMLPALKLSWSWQQDRRWGVIHRGRGDRRATVLSSSS